MMRKRLLPIVVGLVWMGSISAVSVVDAEIVDPCTPPTAVIGSAQETAWRVFVAATCPVNQNQYPYVVWENWVEQTQSYPANPAKGLSIPNSLANEINKLHRLHGSPLTKAIERQHGKRPTPDGQCDPASTPPSDDPKRVICEEVRINGALSDYISGAALWNRNGQEAAATAGANIQTPLPSVEIKADWIQLKSCKNPPQDVHIEKIGNQCLALAGMHLISKLTSNWIWATFEAQNSFTNPERCQALGCNDPFGSVPATSTGANTDLSAALSALMTQAKLANEWTNYRLDGVQTDFLNSDGSPNLLGNSVIEGENAGVPLTQSSCISCHAISSVKSDGTDGLTLLAAQSGFPTGTPAPLPSSDWIARDFVWSMGEACPSGQGLQTCLGKGGE